MIVTDELTILRLVIERLNQANIAYMVSGSLAMNYYAQPRMTRDIDIVIEAKLNDAHRLYELFSGDFYIDEHRIQQAISQRGMFNIIHTETVIKIDLIVRKPGVYRETEFARRRLQKLGDMEAYLVAPEDLILSKLHWAKDSRSELQLNDVRNLLSATRQTLDMDYLNRWAGELSVSTMLNEIL